jgi:predicted nuclease of predicted toxin-antitoxin system
MALALYMDQHVPRAITTGLRLRGVDVLTAYEDNRSDLADPALLDRANELQRVLFTRDDDLLIEASQRQRAGMPFRGVIYAHQLRVSIGKCVEDLELIAQVGEAEDLMNGVKFLPL